MNHTVTREELDVALLQIRAEHEAALLQIHAEIAEDRKRITVIEEFSRELYSILFVKFRSIRMDLETRLKSHVPYFFSSSTPKQSMGGEDPEGTHTYPYV